MLSPAHGCHLRPLAEVESRLAARLEQSVASAVRTGEASVRAGVEQR